MTRSLSLVSLFSLALLSPLAGCSSGEGSDNSGTPDMTWTVDLGGSSRTDMGVPKSGSTLVFASVGGVGNEAAQAVATDAAGNIYVTGPYVGGLDLGGGALQNAGKNDLYVAKFDAAGKHLWSKSFGGVGQDTGSAVTLDRSGNVWVTGSFQNVVDFGGGMLTSAGNSDVFILSLGGADGAYRSAWRYGGGDNETAVGIGVDSTGAVVITGAFGTSVDFGGGMLTSAGNFDGYLLKVSSTGAYVWARRFGDYEVDTGSGVVIGAGDDVFMVGSFVGTSDIGGGAVNAAGPMLGEVLVARLSATGTVKWSKGIGARFDAYFPAIALDPSGNLFLATTFEGSCSVGGAIYNSDGFTDVAVAKWTGDGVHEWSYQLSGPGYEYSDGVTSDPQGNMIVVGHFNGQAKFGGPYIKSYGNYDSFVSKLGGSNGQHIFSLHLGGPGIDATNDVVADPQGNVWVAGQYDTVGEFGTGVIDAKGGTDSFLVKLAP